MKCKPGIYRNLGAKTNVQKATHTAGRMTGLYVSRVDDARVPDGGTFSFPFSRTSDTPITRILASKYRAPSAKPSRLTG